MIKVTTFFVLFYRSSAHILKPANQSENLDYVALYKKLRAQLVLVNDENDDWISGRTDDLNISKQEKLRKRLITTLDTIQKETIWRPERGPIHNYTGPTEWQFLTDNFMKIETEQTLGMIKTSQFYLLTFKLKINKLVRKNIPQAIIHIGEDYLENRYPLIEMAANSRNILSIGQSKDANMFKHEHDVVNQWHQKFKIHFKKGTIVQVKILKDSQYAKIFLDSELIGSLRCNGVRLDNPEELQPLKIGGPDSVADMEIKNVYYKHINDPDPTPAPVYTLAQADDVRLKLAVKRKDKNTNNVLGMWRKIFG